MSIAALITWVITAGFGFFMLIRWATRGGLRHVAGARPTFHQSDVLAFQAGRCQVPVSFLPSPAHDAGLDRLPTSSWLPSSASSWSRSEQGRESSHGRRDSRRRCEAARRDASGVDLAEQHIPRPPVVLHGIFAVSTVILVLLTRSASAPADLPIGVC